MFCSNCGKEIDENVKFCSNCGKEIDVLNDNDLKQELKKGNKGEKIKKDKKIKLKKLLVFVAIILVVFLCAKIIKNINTTYYSLGDTVETEVLRVTLDKAEFALALNSRNDYDFATPKKYNASDSSNLYVANKGHTLVAFTFTIENLDRTTVDIGGAFNPQFATVTYKGKNYSEEVQFAAESNDNVSWKNYTSDNILMYAGEKIIYRAFIDIPVEVESLDDDFCLNFLLPNIKNKSEEFKFEISKEDRENLVEPGITLDIAVKYFTEKQGYEYFKSNFSKYKVVNGSEMKNILLSKKWHVDKNDKENGGTYSGTFTFEASGKIHERSDNGYAVGYINNRNWSINGNILVLTWEGKEVHTDYCEMRKVEENIYLLIRNNEPFMLIK